MWPSDSSGASSHSLEIMECLYAMMRAKSTCFPQAIELSSHLNDIAKVNPLYTLLQTPPTKSIQREADKTVGLDQYVWQSVTLIEALLHQALEHCNTPDDIDRAVGGIVK